MPTLGSLHVSDDETILVVTNTSHIGALSTSTGAVLGIASHNPCLTQVSPWATPVMLLAKSVALVCPSPWRMEVYSLPAPTLSKSRAVPLAFAALQVGHVSTSINLFPAPLNMCALSSLLWRPDSRCLPTAPTMSTSLASLPRESQLPSAWRRREMDARHEHRLPAGAMVKYMRVLASLNSPNKRHFI